MADVTWTEEQLAAITARNPGVLVSAGAGSGKTAVLTERVVQRIFDPVDPVHYRTIPVNLQWKLLDPAHDICIL